MQSLIIRLQEIDINKKLAEAPDDSYGIGIFIGTFLPFIILVIIAYTIYRYNKNRIKDE
ncbi:hypothetical protein OAB20_06065 [Winogradskyella sp.]|nr:hypothetical protein [Winogradskyella sp.]MDC1505511.1 hypothetical protein [Winogradskyella sp.]